MQLNIYGKFEDEKTITEFKKKKDSLNKKRKLNKLKPLSESRIILDLITGWLKQP